MVLAALAVHGRTSPQASAPPAPSTPSPAVTKPALPQLNAGLNTGRSLLGLGRRELESALDDIAGAGFTWIRVDFSWTDIQPVSKDSYTWGPTDRVVRAARAHDLDVLGLISYTPAWARRAGCRDFTCPPASTPAFADFAGEVADRYVSRGVGTYQLWNEPNLDLFWQQPDPVAYGDLVRRAATALRRGHDGVRVVFGSMVVRDRDADGVDPAVFVRAACKRGCPVDAVGFDPYTFPDLPSATGKRSAWATISRGGVVRRTIDQSIGADVPVWVTQFGAPVTEKTVHPPYVDVDRQSEIIMAGLRLARQDQLIGGFFVNSWRDAPSSSDYRDHFGLWGADGTARPAVASLRKALSRQP
ncbi:hypothetical protein G5C66_04615 [Nocardioides sp. KC13]|uniref:Cellulase family glycosylhydrolase n=1 Tax=Nocardioides turkmenicus TaxID=2711220 RepID=A0A6M1QWE9_9ACTN|nr:hypothetical protein [Nocardioides sp. KC13]NGN92020.1 hypothetical protein [Nocardioides sp. KC13]